MLTAAIYARYSSELQRVTSIEDQVHLCRLSATKFGCTILEDHGYYDAEVSGTIAERDGSKRLLAGAKARQFDAIIVEAQDRLWRDQAEMHLAIKRFRYWGIKVFSVATSTDITDETGNIVATITGLKDSMFSEDLRKKTRRVGEAAIGRGLSAGGRTFGYHSEPVRDEG